MRRSTRPLTGPSNLHWFAVVLGPFDHNPRCLALLQRAWPWQRGAWDIYTCCSTGITNKINKSARTEGSSEMALVKGYRFTWGGGPIFRPKPPVFDRSWRSPSKNTVKNSTEDTCSWTRPSKIGKRKVKKPRVFQLFDLNFLVCNIFFCGSAGRPGPEADFWVFGPVFWLIFVLLW